jgi:hypothetical protein
MLKATGRSTVGVLVLSPMIVHMSHSHANYTPEQLVQHFAPQLISIIALCASLFSAVAAIRNLRRRTHAKGAI